MPATRRRLVASILCASFAASVSAADPVSRLAEAVRFRTISPQRPADFDPAPFLAFHAFLAERFPAAHEALERETVSEYSLLYTWRGSDPSLRPVLLAAHQDVVPVIPGSLERWTQPPFGGVVAEGYVWGRGTLDDKVGVMGLLEAVESLVADGFEPRRTIYLAFGHDEEIGGSRDLGFFNSDNEIIGTGDERISTSGLKRASGDDTKWYFGNGKSSSKSA